MKRYLLFVIVVFNLFLSCRNTKQGDLLEIPVDIDQINPLKLSEITEELMAIELELTDESLINPDLISRIILCSNELIIAESFKIFVFSKDGKFLRTIGSRGQGPGEYISINNISIDEKNKYLYIISPSKIICYNLNGKFLHETYNNTASFSEIIFFNDKIFLVGQKGSNDEEKGFCMNSALYRYSNDFRFIDSIFIRNTIIGNFTSLAFVGTNGDFLFNYNSNVYLYFPNNFLVIGSNSANIILADTLYCIDNNQLIPELKLKFKDNGIDKGGNKFIDIFNIYKSSRYIFSKYENKLNDNSIMYFFCYDTKTRKSYNMIDGYIDDIHQIEKPVKIRPFNFNTEMFYYLHTNIKPDDKEEPNPTLYIGKLKTKN